MKSRIGRDHRNRTFDSHFLNSLKDKASNKSNYRSNPPKHQGSMLCLRVKNAHRNYYLIRFFSIRTLHFYQGVAKCNRFTARACWRVTICAKRRHSLAFTHTNASCYGVSLLWCTVAFYQQFFSKVLHITIVLFWYCGKRKILIISIVYSSSKVRFCRNSFLHLNTFWSCVYLRLAYKRRHFIT